MGCGQRISTAMTFPVSVSLLQLTELQQIMMVRHSDSLSSVSTSPLVRPVLSLTMARYTSMNVNCFVRGYHVKQLIVKY